MSTPIVDVAEKTVTHEGHVFTMRPLSDDQYTILIDGVPVGRTLFSFGAAQAVVEGHISEEVLTAVGEAWFAAIDT
jgi:hypothetical protein